MASDIVRQEAGSESGPGWIPRLREVIRRTRLLESLQLIAPGLCGVALAGGFVALREPLTGVFITATLAHQIFTYNYNDYCDFVTDQRNPSRSETIGSRRGSLQIAGVSAIFFFLVLPWLPVWTVSALLLAQLAAVLYSEPHTRFKARAPLGELLHALTGAVYFWSGIWLVGGTVVESRMLLGGLAFAATYTSGSCLSQLLDRRADAEAGHRTLAVWRGERTTRGIGLILQGVALISFACLTTQTWSRSLVAILLVVLLGFFIRAATTGWSAAVSKQYRLSYRLVFAAAVAVVIASSLGSSPR